MRIGGLSRRALLRSAATAAVAPLLFGQSHGGRRVLALIGDRYHNADYIRVALMKMFDGVFVSVDYTIQLDQPLEPGLGLLRIALRRGCQ